MINNEVIFFFAVYMNDGNQWSHILSVTVEVHFIASSGDINPRQ